MKLSTLKFNKDFWIKIIIEAFSVVFAVLLALGVNKCNGERQNEELAKRAMENIQEELRNNNEILKTTIAQCERSIKECDSLILLYKKHPEKTEKPSFKMSFGVVTSVAWEAAKLTEAINFIDFENTIALSGIYEVHEIYKSRFMEYISENNYRDNSENADIINRLGYKRMQLKDIQSVAKQLHTVLEDLDWEE